MVPFPEYVENKIKEQLAQAKKIRQNLESERRLIRTQLKRLQTKTSRGCIRDKILKTKRLEEIEKQLQELSPSSILKRCYKTFLPFVQAYQRHNDLQDVYTLVKQPRQPQQKQQLVNPNQNGLDLDFISDTHLIKDYMESIENHPPEVKVMHKEICEECDEVMVLEPISSMLLCPFCAHCKPYLDATSNHMAYGDEVAFTSFAYLRLNHFNERLTYSQAKETNQIPTEIIEKVMKWLYDNNYHNIENITLDVTYEAMKQLKLRSYYKQNTQLWCRITGRPPLRMTPEYEERLRRMFKAVQNLWNSYKPSDRKNFLSYNYCLYKFNELLGHDEFFPYFKLLKGPKKLQKQDEIFQKICRDPSLNWEFIPSKPHK